jgi:GT2 family glycosyltransferase
MDGHGKLDDPDTSQGWYAVVLSWNGREDTLDCLASLRDAMAESNVICVDNGSTDGSQAAVRTHFPNMHLIEAGQNLGYAGGNNLGIRRAVELGATWVVLVNNDATVAPDVIGGFQSAAALSPRAGILAGKVYFADRPSKIWFAGQRVSLLTGYSGRPRGYGREDAARYQRVERTGRAVGALMAVSREAIELVGLFDEALFAYVEDVDWALRVRAAGLDVVFAPDARAWHRVSASTGGESRSTHTFYYGARNTVVVLERHRPLPLPGTIARRVAILCTFLLHALIKPNRGAAIRATADGFRDALRGRMGVRPEPDTALVGHRQGDAPTEGLS